MSSTNTPSDSPSDTTVGNGTLSNPSATVKDKSTGAVSSDVNDSAAGGPAKQQTITADEQRLLDEVLDLVTTFGPLDGAVKIKLPKSENYILVHGQLLAEKSCFCRGELATAKKEGDAHAKQLALPSPSVVTLAHFLKWIYTDTVLTTPVNHPELKVSWPDLVNLWLFASSIDLPALQNHAVDVLVHKMHSFLDVGEHTEGEIDLVRAGFNSIWRSKHQAQSEKQERKDDKPLRALMMDWFANPMYQTKTDAEQMWAGGISRSFCRDYALHTMVKNFSEGVQGSGDKGDARAHVKAMEDVSQHTLRRLWQIKPENYHVEDDP